MNDSWSYLRDRLPGLARRLAPDIGTAFLGIAALFFVRGFPAVASLDLGIIWEITHCE